MAVGNSTPSASSTFNLPNQITILRLVLALALFVLLSLRLPWPALFVFLLAAATDWIDGYLARRFNQVTQLGRILDPFADKILICGTFIFLAAEPSSGIDAWMAVVVVGRELLVTALRSFLEQRGADFSANMAGKLKMVFQCAAVILSLWHLHHLTQDSAMPQLLSISLPITVWAAVVSTVYSGVGYIFSAVRILRSENN